MRAFRFLLLGLAAALILSATAFAQETQTRVVDEVVAVVNDDVITLSRIKREKEDMIDSYKQEGKTPEEAKKMVEGRDGEMIANLINEQLLLQKAKEIGLDADIDASINARFLEIMKQNNLKTVDALYQMMQSQGVDPQEIREMWRRQATRERVVQSQVQAKVYWEANGKELKDYFEKNKEKFVKPETVSYSELYLGFAGRDENAVRAKAKDLYDQLKKGGDFDKIVAENSDKGIVTQGTGKAEDVAVNTMIEKLKNTLSGVKPGDYTLPMEVDNYGMVILRVDKREAGGGTPEFNEDAVRLAILQEKYPAAQKKFMADLRRDAYIKVNDTYRPIVNPILYADERGDDTTKTSQK